MENKEEIHTALEDFVRLPNGAVPEVLDEYLSRVAVSGVTMFPWCKVKPLLRHKLDIVMKEFQERAPVDCQTLCPNIDNIKFEDMHKRLLNTLDQFTGTPFTIQRLCELVTDPTKHYKKADKFMRGVEKNLAVVTTVDSFGNCIVSESKSLVNGIDACPEQTVTVNQNNVENKSLTEEQLSGLCLPSEPVNSPPADSTEASVSGSSWFTGLTSVVESPNSYPSWCDGETAVSSQSSVTSGSSKSGRLSSLVFDGDAADDEVEPPAKRQLLDHTSSPGDDVSTTTVFSPLLCQLLSLSVEKNEKGSTDDDTVDDSSADSATDDTDQSPDTDKNVEVTPDNEVENEQHQGSEIAVKSELSESSVDSASMEDCSSEDVCNSSAVDDDSNNTSLAAPESESDSERSAADLLESSSDSSGNEADELDVSFAERDNANICVDDVTCDRVHVSTTTADGPSASAINSADTKLAATADIDNDDHRHFIGSDGPYGDLMQHDAVMSESLLVSRVAVD